MRSPKSIDASSLTRELDSLTPGQRWRLRRDLVIFLAARQGASHRMLASVFDLPHSRIYQILKNMKKRYDEQENKPE